jgi:hypothetical protein
LHPLQGWGALSKSSRGSRPRLTSEAEGSIQGRHAARRPPVRSPLNFHAILSAVPRGPARLPLLRRRHQQ